MPTQTIIRHKGINRWNNRLNMGPNWMWDIKNGYINRENDITQRNGITKFNANAISGTPKIRYQYEVKWDDGNKRMICRAGTAWYKEDGDAIWDSLDSARTNDIQGQAVMFNDVLIMVDNSTPRKCGSDWVVTNLGDAPADCSVIHVHNHHVILNSAAAPLNVYISALNNAEDYTTAKDAFILDLGVYIPGGDTIIGFETFEEDLLVIYMKKHVVVFNAPEYTPDWSIQQKIPTGAVTNYATAYYGKRLYIPGLEGVNTFLSLMQTGGERGVPDMTQTILPLYRDYMTSLTSANWKYICGGVGRKLNHYYICFPLAGGHEIIVYSFDLNAVVGRFTGLTMHSFCEREDGTILIGGGAGISYKMNEGTNDDGTTFTFALSTPYYYLANKENYKVARTFETLIEHTATFTYNLDYLWDTQAGATLSKSIASNSLNRTIDKNEDILGRGHAIAYKLYHNTKDALITIPRWTTDFTVEGRK